MNTKLDNITTQYRKFNVNQALTEGQLNEFIDYFEDQDRLSRTRLIGVGVGCGLKVGLTTITASRMAAPDGQSQRAVIHNPDGQVIEYTGITITNGAGVTTDGDLVTLRRNVAGKKVVTINHEEENYVYFRNYIDKYKYPHFFMGDTQMPLVELFTVAEYQELIAKGAESSSFTPITELQSEIQNKIAILYLESYANEERPCEDVDCDNSGVEQMSELKVLLANKTDVETYVTYSNGNDSIFKRFNAYEVLYKELKEIEVPRVILNRSITTDLGLRTKFQNAIQGATVLEDLTDGFSEIAGAFGIYMDLGMSLRDKLNQVLNTSFYDYQYRYDLLKDLVDTYNEMKDLVLHLKAECCPDIEAFPKHLMLGPVGAPLNLGDHTPFRHAFYNAPINTTEDENKERLLLLVNRFIQKLKDFQSFRGPIVITPSNLNVRLGDKAVPFYYDVNDSLLSKWNYEKTRNGKQTYNLSYHKANLASDDFVRNPLLYNLDNNDFFVVEGFLGMPYKIALQNINDLRDQYGLPFKVMAISLQKSTERSTTGRVATASATASPTATLEASSVSIKDLRERLVSISSDISRQAGNTQRTLQTIAGLDNQLRLLNAVDFKASETGVSVVKQNPKEDKVDTEFLSDFLDLKSGLEHYRGVPYGGTLCLIYESNDNDTVIADFALPYLCCSKKDPVFLALPVAKLCQNDAPVPFTIIPLDGDIKAYAGDKEITVVTQTAGQNFFNPAMVATQYFGQSISFTVNDDPVDATMIVNAQPNVTVTAGEPIHGEVPDHPDAKVIFTVTGNVSGLTYTMNFGDGKTESKAVPSTGKIEHTYLLVAGKEDTFVPTITITNGSGCSKKYDLKPIVITGQTTVKCLSNLEIIVQYHPTKGPCPGGHVCNSARFNLMANTVNLGLVNLNNSGALIPSQQSYAQGETSGASRMNSFTISPTQAQAIVTASQPNDGFISFSLVCADSHCHTGVAWTTLKLDGAVIYNGCPTNNFLTINPCTGEVRK